MGVHRRKILSAVGASMALIGGLLAATALVGVVPAGAVTLWAPTTACGVFDTTTVPAGVTSMTIKVEGARAGAAGSGTSSGTEKSDPGFGGKVTATVAVAPGATISAVVGCQGGNFPSSNCGGNPTRPASSAGWSKGGAGGLADDTAFCPDDVGTGAGGASSAVCVGGTCSALDPSTAAVVAGGGGSAGLDKCSGAAAAGRGGDGGSGSATAAGGGSGPSGVDGESAHGAAGGSAAGGAGGVNSAAGSANGGNANDGTGGLGVNASSGAGGGGWRGGAAGQSANFGCSSGGGAGGGSSWSKSSNTAVSFATSALNGTGAVAVIFADPQVTTTSSQATTSTTQATTSTTQATTSTTSTTQATTSTTSTTSTT
ncbi:MAG: hypothetical protein WAR60_05390, partial [Candidatus Microthrix parvicella]